ncbi:MAG: hypothetical protein WDA16_01740 [Candidatus Thermoplasmatota archaeon]
MRITVTRATTAGEIVQHVHEMYGSEADLRKRLKTHKRDAAALIALHNLREYADASPQKRITETREVVVPDDRLDLLTGARLHLLLSLKRERGAVKGVRRLAELAERDVKNVSEDLRVLQELGLVEIDHEGRGRPSTIRLSGDTMSLHLIEDGAQT